MVLKDKTGPGQATNRMFQEDIGETLSLIYAPFYLKDKRVMDAVLNKELPLAQDTDKAFKGLDLVQPAAAPHFIAGICPGCGWNLEGFSDSLILVCRNCRSLWRAKRDRLSRIKFGAAAPAGPTDVMVPFWKIRAQISPMNLSSHGDLARMAPQIGVIPRHKEDAPLFFWCPAFKLNPSVFLRLLGQITAAQPDPNLTPAIEDNPYQPVTLPPSEAVQSIRITMASLLRPRKDVLEALPVTQVVPQKISLVFLPFESRYHDIVHAQLNVAINKNTLALSANL